MLAVSLLPRVVVVVELVFDSSSVCGHIDHVRLLHPSWRNSNVDVSLEKGLLLDVGSLA